MTTVANSFSLFTNMQAQEDTMEVSTDQERKNAMAMEEDNFDIDLEIGEEPRDEDSMMDDDVANDGHNVTDADQQMDDDFQESRDQDDEVLDFVENPDPLVEIPMADDVPQPPTDIGIGQPTQSFPSTVSEALKPQSTTQPSMFQQTQNSDVQNAQEAQPDQSQESLANLDHFESIRNLYEGPQTEKAPEASAKEPENNHAAAAQSEESKEPTVSAVEDTNQEAVHTDDQQDQKPSQSQIDSSTEAGEVLAGTREPAQPQSGEQKESLNTAVHPDQEHETQDDVSTEQDAAAVGTTKEPLVDNEQEEKDQSGSEPVVEPIGVVVTCQGHQMSLFPPLQEHGTPETYLLSEHRLASSPIRSLISACTGILADSMAEHEELELLMPSLKLSFREHFDEAEHYSIRDICDLHFQLHQNDGVENPESLHIVLEVKPRLSGHIDYLYTLAAEGKGIHFLTHESSMKPEDGDSLEANHEKEVNDISEQADENTAETEENFEEDEFGEPDLPQSELDFDGLEEHHGQDEADGEVQNANGATSEEATEQQNDHQSQPETELSESGFGNSNAREDVPSRSQVTEAVVEEQETQAENEAEERSKVALNVQDEVHASAELRTDVEAHVQGDAGTDFNPIEHDDAQRNVLEAALEPSQSLHSATQPDETVSRPNVAPSEAAATEIDDFSQKHDNAPNMSETSSSTIQGNNTEGTDESTKANIVDEGDLFGEVYEAIEDADDDIEDENDGDGVQDGQIDLGLDEPAPPATPQSLKRSRTAAGEEGKDAEDDDGHQLKRTRSG